MPIMLNSLMTQIGLDPANAILLRHQDKRAARGRTPYELWRDNRRDFERYQSTQNIKNIQKFSRGPAWASFVDTPDGATIFDGTEGFWHRWMEYVMTGHGGNVALKSREPSDYQVSILEVAGSNSQVEDIRKMEDRWKAKLQSWEMGLNRN